MEILVICQYYYPEQFRINDICAELVKHGYSVTVLTGQPNYPEGDIYDGYEDNFEEIINGVNVMRCKIRPRKKGTLNLGLNYLSYMFSANKAVKSLRKDFDIVFVYQLSPILMAVPGITFRRKSHVPLFLYCCDIWPESIRDVFRSERGMLLRVIKLISSGIYRSADKIGVKSPSFIDYLAEVCGVKKNKIVYIAEHAEDAYLLLDSHPIDNKVINFMFMGNIGKSQDCDKIVKAAAMMRIDKEFRIHFVGDGSMLDSLKMLVDDAGLTDKIVFHGRHSLSEMPEYYKIADVCLLTLTIESAIGLTIPGKLLGYMAAGKPVVAAISGDAASIIRESGCGYCTESGNISGLAMLMEECIHHSDRLEKLGQNGRLYFKEHFTKQVFMEQLEFEFTDTIRRFNAQ